MRLQRFKFKADVVLKHLHSCKSYILYFCAFRLFLKGHRMFMWCTLKNHCQIISFEND